MAVTISMILSGSLVFKRIGMPESPTNDSISMALPSMTGIAASGPISPSPNTAVPSVTMATRWLVAVYMCASFGSLAIFKHTSATPGV